MSPVFVCCNEPCEQPRVPPRCESLCLPSNESQPRSFVMRLPNSLLFVDTGGAGDGRRPLHVLQCRDASSSPPRGAAAANQAAFMWQPKMCRTNDGQLCVNVSAGGGGAAAEHRSKRLSCCCPCRGKFHNFPHWFRTPTGITRINSCSFIYNEIENPSSSIRFISQLGSSFLWNTYYHFYLIILSTLTPQKWERND